VANLYNECDGEAEGWFWASVGEGEQVGSIMSKPFYTITIVYIYQTITTQSIGREGIQCTFSRSVINLFIL